MFPRLAALFAAAFVLAAPAFAAGPVEAGVSQAQDAVTGAEADLSDARAYLADLQKGDFAGIYGVGEDGSLRCGETEANPACAPLNEVDKVQALAEAKEMVASAEAELKDARVQLADAGGNDNVRTASFEAR